MENEEKDLIGQPEEASIISEPIAEDEVTLDDGLIMEDSITSSGTNYSPDETVTVQAVEFPSFDTSSQTQGDVNKNLDLLMDVKLQLSVELGRAELPIKKVLELTRGSIVELDKIAGEPVELFANGKLVAHGEVVVIEDNFGLRITSIYESEDRLRNFQ